MSIDSKTARRRLTDAMHAMHGHSPVYVDADLAAQLEAAWHEYDAAIAAAAGAPPTPPTWYEVTVAGRNGQTCDLAAFVGVGVTEPIARCTLDRGHGGDYHAAAGDGSADGERVRIVVTWSTA